MARTRRRPAWLLLTAFTHSSHFTHAYYIPLHDALGLTERAITCSASGFTPCPQANLPDNFCCSAGTTCDILAGNTTLLCCPTGRDCSAINPITCDVSAQNPQRHPDASIKTTALNGALTPCGDKACCPFGYSCSSGLCIVNANQNAAPFQVVPGGSAATAQTTSTSATKAAATPPTIPLANPTTQEATTKETATTQPTTQATQTTSFKETASTSPLTVAVATMSSTSSASATTGTAQNANQDKTNTGASSSAPSKGSIVGGVIGGIAGMVLVAAALWFLSSRRRHNKNGGARDSGSSSVFGSRPGTEAFPTTPASNMANNSLSVSISSPRPQGDALYRTDFIRKPPPSRDSSRPSTPGTSNGMTAAKPVSPLSTLGAGGASRAVPRTPPQPRVTKAFAAAQQRAGRAPSMEEINIGADASVIASGGGLSVVTPLRTTGYYADPRNRIRSRSQDRMTTFSSLLVAADLDMQRPFVPNSNQSSPALRPR